MKRKTILIFIAVVLASCEYKDLRTSVSVLIGKWKLIETLVDPGDGSGTFTNVSSNKMISFYSDSIFYSNGSMCQMSINSDHSTEGTYSPKQKTITPVGCASSELPIHYEIKDEYLIVYYRCDEGCAEKYIMD